jgi:Rrf2 family protein
MLSLGSGSLESGSFWSASRVPPTWDVLPGRLRRGHGFRGVFRDRICGTRRRRPLSPQHAVRIRRQSPSGERWLVQNPHVHIPAKVDYGMRALLTLVERGEPATAEELAEAQGLPPKFLGAILNDLRRAGVVASRRGSEGGYRLARPAVKVTVADVMRALDGPLAEVRGIRPEAALYEGAAEHLQDVWVAVRASLRRVLDNVTLDDVVRGRLPRSVARLTEDPDAWSPRR